MTANNERNVSYESLMQDMHDRHAYMEYNEMYDDIRYKEEFAVLEDMLCDVVDDGSNEHERLEQKASNDVLIAFSRASSDTDGGGGCADRRIAAPAVPNDTTEPDTAHLAHFNTHAIFPAPGIVTRGYLCNRVQNPPISSGVDVTPKIKHGSADGGAKICYWLAENEEAHTTLIGALETGKQRALSANQCNEDGKPVPVIITLSGRKITLVAWDGVDNDVDWEVVAHPTGARIGVYYAYHISFGGMDVFIHKDMTPKNDQPNIWVDYRADSVLKYDSHLYGADSVFRDFMSSLGFTIVRDRLSRIDPQIMIDVPVRKFVKLYLGDHDVSKARNFTINGKKKAWGKVIETFKTVTENRIELDIYDKLAEILKKYNAETAAKYDMTCQNIGLEWLASDRPITRVEFRLFRDALRHLGVESLEDFRQRERAIMEYLTKDWFRLLTKPKVRGTENDADIHPDWVRVQNLFFEYFSCAEVPKVKWQKPTRVSVDSVALEKQGLGCLAMAAVAKSGEQKSPRALRNRTCELVQYSEDDVEKFNQRIRRIEVEKGVKFVEQTMVGFNGEELTFHMRR